MQRSLAKIPQYCHLLRTPAEHVIQVLAPELRPRSRGG